MQYDWCCYQKWQVWQHSLSDNFVRPKNIKIGNHCLASVAETIAPRYNKVNCISKMTTKIPSLERESVGVSRVASADHHGDPKLALEICRIFTITGQYWSCRTVHDFNFEILQYCVLEPNLKFTRPYLQHEEFSYFVDCLRFMGYLASFMAVGYPVFTTGYVSGCSSAQFSIKPPPPTPPVANIHTTTESSIPTGPVYIRFESQ